MATSVLTPDFWYKLDESGGTTEREDSVNGTTARALEPTGTGVGARNPGKINFGADGQQAGFLRHKSADLFIAAAGSFSLACWILWDTFPTGTQYPISHWDDGGGTTPLFLCYSSNSEQRPHFQIADNAANFPVVDWGVNLSTGTWHFVCAGYDQANDEIWISVNGGTKQTTAVAGTNLNAPGGDSRFSILKIWNSGPGFESGEFNGGVDEVGLYEGYVLSSGDINYLFNANAGRSYPLTRDADPLFLLAG